MTRRALLFLPVLLASRAGFHVRGRLEATDQEAQEGYFSCGRDLAIVTRPHSLIHDDLLAMRGTDVQVSVFNP